MRTGVEVTARVISTLGLAGVSALHSVWAARSPWPAKDQKQLAEAVVGSHSEMPGTASTLVVAGGGVPQSSGAGRPPACTRRMPPPGGLRTVES